METLVKDRMDQTPDLQDIEQQWKYFMGTLQEAQENTYPAR